MMRVIGKIVLSVGLFLSPRDGLHAGDSPVPLSVCESLTRADEIRGKPVTVTGVLESTPGGLLLTDESRRHISIDGTEIRCELAVDTVNEKGDAIQRKLNAAAKVVALAKRPEFAALLFTVEGIVESDRDRAISVGTRHTRPRAGYGHLGLRPGELSMADIVSVTLKYSKPDR